MSRLNPFNWSTLALTCAGIVSFASAVAFLEYKRANKRAAKPAADGKDPLLNLDHVDGDASAKKAAVRAGARASHGASTANAASSSASGQAGPAGEAALEDIQLDVSQLSPDQQESLQRCFMLQQHGRALVEQHQFAEALKMFTLAIELLKLGLGHEHIMVSEALYELAALEPALDQPAAAIAHHEEAHRIRIANLGSNHSLVAESHIKLAQLLAGQGLNERAHGEIAIAKAMFSTFDLSQTGTQINLASTDLIGAEISADLGRVDEALKQARNAKHVFQTLMPDTVLAFHASTIIAMIMRDSNDYAGALHEYLEALQTVSATGNETVSMKIKTDLYCTYSDMGDEPNMAKIEAELMAAPLISAPLSESKLLKSRFASVEIIPADGENKRRAHIVVILIPRKSMWKSVNPEGKVVHIDLDMEETNSTRTLHKQKAAVSMENINDSPAKIFAQSPPITNIEFGTYRVVVRMYLDEERTQLIATHRQLVVCTDKHPEPAAEDADAHQ